MKYGHNACDPPSRWPKFMMHASPSRRSPCPVFLFFPFLIAAGCGGNPERPAQVSAEPVMETHEIAIQPPAPQSHFQPTPQPVSVETTEAPHTDLWARIRAGFRLDHYAHERIDRELAFYQRHPATLPQFSQRAAPYLHLITEEVEKRGMPLELALLPMIESGYRPFAYSHGRAAGLWQFIPSTGRYFGLRQDWWYDGRRDVTASTRAALDYLQRLHKDFDGDWYQAIASYNAGEANVFRAIRRNKKKGEPTDFWNLQVPKETHRYVPRLLALARMVAAPDRYGIELKAIRNEAVVRPVNAEGQIDLAVVSHLAGVDMQELYALNPAYNRWATPPQGPHHFLLPLEAADRLEQALAGMDDKARMRWDRHKVRKGESLSRIAQRYRTSVRQIREANHLQGDAIRAGQDLLVPRAGRRGEAYVLSAEQRLRKAQTRGRGVAKRYAVQTGDSLWSIARRHGVSHHTLAKWNNMALNDPLRAGRELVLYTSTTTAAAQPTSPLPVSLRNQRITYQVRKGDSLYKIAQRFRVSIHQIRNWNRLRRNAYLQPGQKLLLHVDVTRQS